MTRLRFAAVFWVGMTWLWVALEAKLAYAQRVHTEAFQSGARSVQYEVFSSVAPKGPVLILLPGTSGAQAPFYRDEAAFYAGQGYTTLLLHYFDAFGTQAPGEASYQAWAKALADLVARCAAAAEYKGRAVVVLGYSLGASVALAAGSQGLPVQGIAEWYGSLPDSFFYRLRAMPPLLILHGAQDSNIPVMNAQQLERLCGMKHFDCTTHIYPEESHGFSAGALRDAEQRTVTFFQAHAEGSSSRGTTGANP